MKTTKLFSMILLGIMLISVSAFAGDKKAEAKKELKNQTNCPVMGGAIDSSIYTDIQGQRVYHCCPMCKSKLQKDPDTYFKKAGEQGILFENIQKTCPVSGEELDENSVYSDFEGRRIYFCCKKCRGTFNEDPQKVLKSMDGKSGKMDMKHEMKKDSGDGHSGHNH